MRPLTYGELAEQLPQYVKEIGFTHVEFLPVSEYNFEGSLGYHPIALYAPTGRFGSPDEFRLLVDRCHQEGIGVILNWVPVQFPDDPQAPGRFDGPALYEHPDPQEQRHLQWNTLLYNYGRPGVFNDLFSNALFWLDCYHIDGLASILYLDYGRQYRATARLNAEGALGQITRGRLRVGVTLPCLKGGNARNRYLPNRYSPSALSSLISASQRLRSLLCPYIRA